MSHHKLFKIGKRENGSPNSNSMNNIIEHQQSTLAPYEQIHMRELRFHHEI